MHQNPQYTEFAPPERATDQQLQQQRARLEAQEYIAEILDSIPSITAIINAQRQIVCANRKFKEFFGSEMVGLRPGEAANCIHCNANSGCGTSAFCQTCGLIGAVIESLQIDDLAEQECRMSRTQDGEPDALDLRVWSRPLNVEGETFSLVSMLDISHEKRRDVLERIFFHDVMNTAGGIQGASSLLLEMDITEEEMYELAELLNISSYDLIDEIQAQKTLSHAEKGDLEIEWSTLEARELIESIKKKYLKHPAAENRTILIHPDSESFSLKSDSTLLRRVLGNLLKNALEASPEGHSVTLRCRRETNLAIFSVHNQGVIPMPIQRQIFNRSFSTKGTGRGLGTYSIKLLTETYLEGAVTFFSTEEIGTLFRIELPLEPPKDGQ